MVYGLGQRRSAMIRPVENTPVWWRVVARHIRNLGNLESSEQNLAALIPVFLT